MVNDKINVVGTNIAEKAIMIWNVADMLRDPFKPHEYGLVILPMIHFNPRSPCGERHSMKECSSQVVKTEPGGIWWKITANVRTPKMPCFQGFPHLFTSKTL